MGTRNAEVVASGASTTQSVSQVWCSAVPVSLGESDEHCSEEDWEPLARVVLEAAYEATLLAGVISSSDTQGKCKVMLCLLGNGVYGNKVEWIIDSMNIALRKFKTYGFACDVHVMHYGPSVPQDLASEIGLDKSAPMKVRRWVHNCGGGDLELSMAIPRCKWCSTERPS